MSFTIIISRNKNFFADEAYKGFSEEILHESIDWENHSHLTSELILRSWQGAIPSNLPKHYSVPCRISIEQIIKTKLYKTVQEVVKRRLTTLDIYSEGTFKEIPQDEIYSLVSILAADKMEKISGNTRIHFFVGNFNDSKNNTTYVFDSNRRHVFLQADKRGGFAESLSRYLKTNFDPDKLELIDRLEADVKEVKEAYILPSLEETGHDNGAAFQNLHDRFQDLPNETVIKILSWFRYQSYSEGLGNASRNNEKEIEDDYRENPWNFVYC